MYMLQNYYPIALDNTIALHDYYYFFCGENIWDILLISFDIFFWYILRYSFERKVKVLITQLCPTFCGPTDCSPPVFSVHGILQARLLEWIAILFSRGSSWPRNWIQVSCIAGRFLKVLVCCFYHILRKTAWLDLALCQTIWCFFSLNFIFFICSVELIFALLQD